MFLPRTAEYGLRAMAQMASLGQGTTVRTKDLASQTLIPEPYLSKILRRFVAAGLLDSINGPGGGFRINQPLKRIRFLDVLAAVGFDLEPNHCAFGLGKCNPKKPCLLHPAYSDLSAGFRQWATQNTLQDVVDGKAELVFSSTR